MTFFHHFFNCYLYIKPIPYTIYHKEIYQQTLCQDLDTSHILIIPKLPSRSVIVNKETMEEKVLSATQVWESVTNCLVNNKCWLCNEVFLKGRIKKVFMVSDIVRCILRRRDEIAARVDAFKSNVSAKEAETSSPPLPSTSSSSSCPPLPPPTESEFTRSSVRFDPWPEVCLYTRMQSYHIYSFHSRTSPS